MLTYKRHIEYEIDAAGQATAVVIVKRFSPPENINTQLGDTRLVEMNQEVTDGLAEIVDVDETVLPDYAEMRRRAYAPTGDQLDLQYHDSQDGTTTWVDHVQKIKAAHPKPE